MADRVKVIKGLEICANRVPGKYDCNKCPYEIDGNYCEINLTNDAIALLKEQQQQIWELQDQVEYLTDKQKKKFFVYSDGKITPLPDIVRCKDCKFRQSRVSRIIDGKECNLCEMVKGYKPADWFCADGKHKRGGEVR